MRNRFNPCGPLLQAFVGLETRDGVDVRSDVDADPDTRGCDGFLEQGLRLKALTAFAQRLPVAHYGTGRYTHDNGTVQEEPALYVEGVDRDQVQAFLQATDQESALCGDDWGRWFLLYDDGREERLPGALAITTGRPEGDHCQLGDLFYQVSHGVYTWSIPRCVHVDDVLNSLP